jgi:hypothetical protein
MKTTLTLITATVVPGGFIILIVALLGYYITRQRTRTAANPVLSGPLIP